jgi:iron complex transport system ATP-binding protein
MTLHATDLTLRLGGERVLHKTSLSAVGGELLALVGAPGSGKSTLLQVCAGLRRPDRGSVWVAGRRDGSWEPVDPLVCRAYLAEQEPWAMDVAACDVVALGAAGQGLTYAERLARAHRALAAVRCAHLAGRSMAVASASEQLRIRLARLMLQMWNVQPDGRTYALLDAAQGLDWSTSALYFQLARTLAKRGAAVVVASHDLNNIMHYAERVVLLRGGNITAEGTPQQVLTPGRLAVALDVDATVETPPEADGPRVVPRPDASDVLLPF